MRGTTRTAIRWLILATSFPAWAAQAPDLPALCSEFQAPTIQAKVRTADINADDAREAAWARLYLGMTKLCKQDVEAAFAEFDAAARLQPREPGVFDVRDRALRTLGQREKQMANAKAMVAALPDLSTSHLTLGIALDDAGDLPNALQAMDEAVRRDATSPYARFSRAAVLGKMGQFRKAVEDYNSIIAAQPDNATLYDALMGRSLAFEGLLDFAHAIEDIDACIKLKPKDPLAYNTRGIYSAERGDTPQAIEDFSRLLQLVPEHVPGLTNRGRAWRVRGDFARSMADLEQALRLKPDHVPALMQRGQTFLLMGNHDEAAEADFSAAVAATPKDPYAWRYRALSEYSLGRFDQVVSDVDQLITLEPSDNYALLVRYWAQTRAGDQAKARTVLERELSTRKVNTWPNPVAQFLLGRISADELSRLAADVPADAAAGKRQHRLCIAGFNIGGRASLDGLPDQAAARLAKAIEDCSTFTESILPRAELKRLRDAKK
jgi:tetratricopeptide (TPR) repeat protein